ncbi:MAG: hypothetical protein ABSG44_21615 [Thermodesulfobacteriota bacterium]
MKWFRCLLIASLGFFVLGSAEAGTYSLNLRYQPLKDLSSLQRKIGPTLAIAPFKDERPETLYIGLHTNLEGDSTYFKSNPFPLEKAIGESLSAVLSRNGIKTIPVARWDDKPESLKNMETNSVLMIEIKRFWTEGKASLLGTKVKTVIQFVIHLGVKKEGKIFTRNVEVEKEMTVPRSTPERVETMMNQTLTEIFDSYFSNPY